MATTFDDGVEEVKIRDAKASDLLYALREMVDDDFAPYLGHEDAHDTVGNIISELERQEDNRTKEILRLKRRVERSKAKEVCFPVVVPGQG